MIETTKCNRFDVITGWNFTFAVDKVEESLSVLRARYRIDDTTFCDETPIIGTQRQYFETVEKVLGSTHFPFVPFAKFWDTWNGYVSLRKSQIAELRSTEQDVTPNA
jgi:negative regulator of replication initiation